MKARYILLNMAVLMGATAFTGCLGGCPDVSDMPDPLPENPIVYQTGELFTDEGTGYVTVGYGGKTYILYGQIKPQGFAKDYFYAFGDCLGYIGDDKTDLIYSLLGESTDEWLIEYSQGYYIEDLKPIPMVLREISTKGSENIPDCVASMDNDYWK